MHYLQIQVCLSIAKAQTCGPISISKSQIVLLAELVPGFVESTEHCPSYHPLLCCCGRRKLQQCEPRFKETVSE